MLTLSKKLFYVIEAVIYIGCNQSKSPVSSKDITKIQGLPSRHLEQMLQKLVHANILRGVRGPKGGYLLAREKRRITLRDIYLVIEEENLLTFINYNSAVSDALYGVWQKMHSATLDILGKTTLAELCANASYANNNLANNSDFTI